MYTKKTLSVLVLCLLISTQAFSTKFRVNSNPDINADFSSLQAAINSSTVQEYDTLYCEGGSYFGDVIMDKNLVIIGPGYFLSQNDSTQSYTATASINNLTLKQGCSGAKIMGMKILQNFCIGNNSANDTVRNVTITRNHIYYLKENTNHYSGNSEYSNIKIYNNYITYQLYFHSYTTSIYVYNNIIIGSVGLYTTTSEFRNNVVINNSNSYCAKIENSNITNNIIINTGNGAALYSDSYNFSYNNNISNNLLSDATNTDHPSNYYSAA